ncbi:hypothetical protein [Xenorhabdus cabanillasii]|uniref:Uncharacterized protein n=1 Tax=Xenorhabdus cabanillasii JM26 TaxID=1427517 RepID=W1ILV9_9GAMM|nr:hypothetical protein [Xenorhabdus cabanillasii]PHM77981.1 hypothetical protein Xcab_01493 [Xenorhabdus cabanillasii JM26]CDL79477.1 hypothetical protein XCR1_1150024 [Xenorhabdus cabanillasii JM26]
MISLTTYFEYLHKNQLIGEYTRSPDRIKSLRIIYNDFSQLRIPNEQQMSDDIIRSLLASMGFTQDIPGRYILWSGHPHDINLSIYTFSIIPYLSYRSNEHEALEKFKSLYNTILFSQLQQSSSSVPPPSQEYYEHYTSGNIPGPSNLQQPLTQPRTRNLHRRGFQPAPGRNPPPYEPPPAYSSTPSYDAPPAYDAPPGYDSLGFGQGSSAPSQTGNRSSRGAKHRRGSRR